MYEVVVYTGYSSHAGTSSEVRMVLTGGLDETSPRRLKDTEPGRRKFCRGNVDYFLLSVPRCLGKLKTLRIWHDNTGDDPSWYLLRVMVHDVQSDIKTWFICDRWLAVEEDDGCVERVLTPASKEELTSFNLLFSTEARKNLTDGHLWFSVVTRPAKSNFTRVQRLSCCLSILLCTMLANAMFYQVGTESSSGTSVHIGPFSFSIKQLSIGITSSLVVLPVNVLIVTFFRKARPAEAKKGLDKDQDPHGQSPKYELSGEKANQTSKESETAEKEDDEKKKENKKKKKKTLPHFFIYISYVLVFVSCTVSATFTVFYGLTFGKEKSAGWLSSMMISFWQDVLISQPLKVSFYSFRTFRYQLVLNVRSGPWLKLFVLVDISFKNAVKGICIQSFCYALLSVIGLKQHLSTFYSTAKTEVTLKRKIEVKVHELWASRKWWHIERFSIERRKPKTKVIKTAN